MMKPTTITPVFKNASYAHLDVINAAIRISVASVLRSLSLIPQLAFVNSVQRTALNAEKIYSALLAKQVLPSLMEPVLVVRQAVLIVMPTRHATIVIKDTL